jgi:hypothetical protein
MTYYFPYAPGKLEPLAMHGDLFVTGIAIAFISAQL